MTCILVVEDEQTILDGLAKNLRLEGYEVATARDGDRGLTLARELRPDLIVLDIMLPKRDGYEVCRLLRREGWTGAILMLTARGRETDKVTGLEIGADDYLTKPFGVLELLARIRALLRRTQPAQQQVRRLQLGEVVVDFEAMTMARAGEPVAVTTRELELLRHLAANPGRALSRRAIVNSVWGADYFGTERTVDNYITRLRQKVEDDPTAPAYLVTVRGVGYRLEPGDPV